MDCSDSACVSSIPSSKLQPDRDASTTHDSDQSGNKAPDLIPQKEAKDFVLNLLATSSGESLSCAVAALIFATYIVLGRVGLLLIGLVLGVLLHASWEGGNVGSRSEVLASRNPKKRRELALELANRLLDWPKRILPEGVNDEGSRRRTIEQGPGANLDYSAFGPRTSAALRSITDVAIRDYVM